MMTDLTDRLISELRARKLPSCPEVLEANVLRRIRVAQAESHATIWAWPGLQFSTARPVLAAVALVMITSAAMSIAAASASAERITDQAAARRAFDFDVIRSTDFLTFDR